MKGMLLVNMGTPETAEKDSVKQFIADILSDPLVSGMSNKMGSFVAKKIIAPLSAQKSSEKYKKIWRTEEPKISPLLYYMQRLAEKLEQSKQIPVEIAMRYGKLSIEAALNKLETEFPGLHEVVIFPLYPQYAQSTTQTLYDELGRIFYKTHRSYRIKITKPYYNHPAYIKALSRLLKPYMEGIDRLLFCYHSLPLKQVEAGSEKGREFDYLYQSKETTRLLCDAVNYDLNDIITLYSSQRGKNWLAPFLDENIGTLPAAGYRRICVVAPGFTVDNLETLYDLRIMSRQLFMQNGGEEIRVVPSLNDSDEWAEAIWKITELL